MPKPNPNPSQVVRPALYGQDALALAKAAQAQGVSIAEIVRQLVRQHLQATGSDMSDMVTSHARHGMSDMPDTPDMSDMTCPKGVVPTASALFDQRF